MSLQLYLHLLRKRNSLFKSSCKLSSTISLFISLILVALSLYLSHLVFISSIYFSVPFLSINLFFFFFPLLLFCRWYSTVHLPGNNFKTFILNILCFWCFCFFSYLLKSCYLSFLRLLFVFSLFAQMLLSIFFTLFFFFFLSKILFFGSVSFQEIDLGILVYIVEENPYFYFVC